MTHIPTYKEFSGARNGSSQVGKKDTPQKSTLSCIKLSPKVNGELSHLQRETGNLSLGLPGSL